MIECQYSQREEFEMTYQHCIAKTEEEMALYLQEVSSDALVRELRRRGLTVRTEHKRPAKRIEFDGEEIPRMLRNTLWNNEMFTWQEVSEKLTHPRAVINFGKTSYLRVQTILEKRGLHPLPLW